MARLLSINIINCLLRLSAVKYPYASTTNAPASLSCRVWFLSSQSIIKYPMNRIMVDSILPK